MCVPVGFGGNSPDVSLVPCHLGGYPVAHEVMLSQCLVLGVAYRGQEFQLAVFATWLLDGARGGSGRLLYRLGVPVVAFVLGEHQDDFVRAGASVLDALWDGVLFIPD